MQVKIKSSKTVYEGFFCLKKFELQYERFDGKLSQPVTLECVERGDAVAVLLYDPHRDELVLIRQFRIGSHLAGDGGWTLEIVAGSSKDPANNQIEAQREVEEETGWQLQRLLPITSYFLSPSGSSEKIHLYYGEIDSQNPTSAGGGVEAEVEDIQTVVLTYDEAMEQINSSKISSATVILALQWLTANRQRLRAEAK